MMARVVTTEMKAQRKSTRLDRHLASPAQARLQGPRPLDARPLAGCLDGFDCHRLLLRYLRQVVLVHAVRRLHVADLRHEGPPSVR